MSTLKLKHAAPVALLLAMSQLPPAAADPVTLLQEYIRIDTTNPPGNESAAVAFLAELLDAEGIDYEIAESAPGRANLWARLEGGDKPGLLLLHHSDVVASDASAWTVPTPFRRNTRRLYLWPWRA